MINLKIKNGKEKLKKVISKIFKKYDKSFNLYDRQADILISLLDPDKKFVWISAPTRYGKSEVVAIGALLLASLGRLRVRIVGATVSKANKIMEYILEHVADNPLIYANLINKDLLDVERLKVVARKTELRWSDGGWISVLTANEGNSRAKGEKLLGEGGDIIIVEEAGLIRDENVFNKIVRMREPDRGWGKIVLVGNLIEGTIFEKAYKDKNYYKVFVTLEEAKKDKGWSDGYLELQKKQITEKDWKRLYAMEWVSGDEFSVFKPKKYSLLPSLNDLEIYGAIDLALGRSEHGSKIGIIILGREKNTGQVYEIESIVKHMKPNEAIDTILNLPYPFVRFGIEVVQFQKYWADVINEKSKILGKYIPFEEIKQTKDKIARIESLEPIINTGQILFKGNNELWEELKDYPDAEFVDGIDALEMTWRLISKSNIWIA